MVSPDALEGTLAYLSPEQTGRMNRVIDHRADLYSLGVTLYQMLVGALPFSASSPMELVHSHIAKAPVPPHVRAPGVPPVVSSLVMKLLAKAAEDRCQSAVGLKADLEACLAALDTAGRIYIGGGQYVTNRRAFPSISDAQLRQFVTSAGRELTYTCTPPGSGERIGVDRDEDGFFDGDERDAGSDPADARSTP